MLWTENKIERLRKLHAEGFSAELTGQKLGVSRNAVIGKWNRLRLGPHDVVHSKDGVSRGNHGFTKHIKELCQTDAELTMREIAVRFGCSYSHVAKVIDQHELPKRPRRFRLDTLASLGRAARDAGMTLADIQSFRKS